jgi:hypothetical protein
MSINGPLGATPNSGAFELRSPSPARTSVTGSRLGLLGLVGVLLTGVVLCVSAARTDSLLPESVRPVPPWMAGVFGESGPRLSTAELLLVLSLMLASYIVAVRAADQLSPRAVLMAIAGFNAIVLLAPPLLSTDVFSYQAYARMWATFGANPYLSGPHVLALDPLYSYIGAKWIATPTAYGPLFTVLSAALANASIALSALTFKVVAAVSCLAIVALIWHAARLRGLNPVRGAALFGLNPLVVLYGVGGGHNDLLMLAFTTAGVYALLAHRERTSGAMIVLGAAIKLTGGLLLPFAFASGVGLGAGRRRRAIAVGSLGAGIAVAALGLAAFGTGPLHLIGTLRGIQAEGDWTSIPGFISTRLGWGGVGSIAGLLLGGAFVGAFVWLLRRVWRGEMDWIDGAAWATFAMLLSTSSLLPWYVAWLMPLVALCTDRRLWTTALWFTALIQLITMMGYIPHSVGFTI